jgi:two-component system OmpR family sensor kinase
MFTSLRSRLLLSYLVIIAVCLSVVALALLALSVTQNGRLLPTLGQLNAIGQAVRRELVRAGDFDRTDLASVEALLQEVSANQDVRIAIINQGTGRVLFDSSNDRSAWSGIQASEVRRPRGEFQAVDPGIPVGRYQSQGGDRWLVFSQPLTGRAENRLIIVYGRPEPGPLRYFGETFLRPLCQAGIIALLASLLLAVLISRSVAGPLQGMAEASESIAKGEFDQQLPLQGPDEVQRLAQSFNSMATQVDHSQIAQRDLVANVSHDLKTPLTAIRGWSQALLDGTADAPDEQRNAILIIQSEADRMQRMVEQLLDLARIESGGLNLVLEEIDLQSLIIAVQNNYSARALAQGIELSAITESVPRITGDNDRLTQAVSNLVDNALVHTPENGHVDVVLQPYGAAFLDIIVQDSGPGIPPAELDRIFERFYRVDKSREGAGESRGSGIGLAIVKELTEAHRGEVFASSQLGRGSAFTIRLPVEGDTAT